MKRSLEVEIEVTREAMMIAAIKEGLTADETLELSRKLDSLMNQLEMNKTSGSFQGCHSQSFTYDNMQ